MKNQNLTFEEAYKELETIVKSLEDNTLTIDEITLRISRASTLITFCREKLKSTDLEVQQILSQLDEQAGKSQIPPDTTH